MTIQGIEDLLKKYNESDLSSEEKVRLFRNLKNQYGYGTPIPEFPCPSCKRPLAIAWSSDKPECFWSEGGCGYSSQ